MENPIWGVVNSAGITMAKRTNPLVVKSCIEENVEQDTKPVFEVNYFGTARINAAFFEMILQNKGVIVNIASMAGRIGSSGLGTYSATKHAVIGYSSSLRKDLRRHGVRVLCFEPGFIATPMTDDLTSKPDFSQTILTKTFNHEVWDKRQSKIRPMMVVEDCSNWIASQMLASNAYPHQIVDTPIKRRLYQFLSILPHIAVDRLFAFLDGG